MGRIQTPKQPTLVKRLAANGGDIRKLQVTSPPVSGGSGISVVGAALFGFGPTAGFFSNVHGDAIEIGDSFTTIAGDVSGIVSPGTPGTGSGTFQLGAALWSYLFHISAVVLPDLSVVTADTDLLILKTSIRDNDASSYQVMSPIDTQVLTAEMFNAGGGVYSGSLLPENLPSMQGILLGTPSDDLALVMELTKIDVTTGTPTAIPMDGGVGISGSCAGYLELLNLGNLTL